MLPGTAGSQDLPALCLPPPPASFPILSHRVQAHTLKLGSSHRAHGMPGFLPANPCCSRGTRVSSQDQAGVHQEPQLRPRFTAAALLLLPAGTQAGWPVGPLSPISLSLPLPPGLQHRCLPHSTARSRCLHAASVTHPQLTQQKQQLRVQLHPRPAVDQIPCHRPLRPVRNVKRRTQAWCSPAWTCAKESPWVPGSAQAGRGAFLWPTEAGWACVSLPALKPRHRSLLRSGLRSTRRRGRPWLGDRDA